MSERQFAGALARVCVFRTGRGFKYHGAVWAVEGEHAYTHTHTHIGGLLRGGASTIPSKEQTASSSVFHVPLLLILPSSVPLSSPLPSNKPETAHPVEE